MLQSGEYIPKSRHMGPSFQDIWGQHKENKLLIENKKKGLSVLSREQHFKVAAWSYTATNCWQF